MRFTLGFLLGFLCGTCATFFLDQLKEFLPLTKTSGAALSIPEESQEVVEQPVAAVELLVDEVGPWPCPELSQNITEIIKKSGSDKWGKHHYERYYEIWLKDLRCKPGLKIVEIGAEHGRSLSVWDKFFTQPDTVLGLAFGSSANGVEKVLGPKTKVIWGDQSKNETMQELIRRGPWDIIVDDGSHIPSHMKYSMFALWDSVKPGGYYIIEDLETNYWFHGKTIYMYRTTNTGIHTTAAWSVVKKIEQITQVLMRHQIGASNLTVMPGDASLCSVEWGMNLVKLRKCTTAERLRNPPMAKKQVYDQKKMEEWLAEARSTNPTV